MFKEALLKMVCDCIVVGCSNNNIKNPDKRFFVIPVLRKHEGKRALSERRRHEWIRRINRKTINSNTVKPWQRVCSDHFISGGPAELADSTNPDWAPTVKMGYDLHGLSSALSSDRYNRKQMRQHRKARAQLVQGSPEGIMVANPDVTKEIIALPENEKCTETELSLHLLDLKETELNRLTVENMDLRNQIDKIQLSEQKFEGDDQKVLFYTGLPDYATMTILYEYLEPFLTVTSRSKLSKFQQLLVVLIKLRLNVQHQVLADLFCVSVSTVSNILLKTIHVMYMRLKPFVHWPERECLQKTMPTEFVKTFGKRVATIIDCFEIEIERPSNFKARAETYSHYKHGHTAKFLISVTPQGVISFLSKGYGGRVSDKFITENCGFLSNLLPGDLVLADRGFDIKESVGLRCAEVKLPAFTKGRPQLPSIEVEKTRQIAHLRIHVERVIGILRQKYTVLNGPVPIDYLITAPTEKETLDKMVIVCSALVNWCPSVVKY